jgi:hypothetical protein
MVTTVKTTAIQCGTEFTGENRICRVIGCHRPTWSMWETMKHGLYVPVCQFHYSRKLWWFKGGLYDHTEEV